VNVPTETLEWQLEDLFWAFVVLVAIVIAVIGGLKSAKKFEKDE
jgi:ABC-type antimicrobial peptide transport system permease subunit